MPDHRDHVLSEVRTAGEQRVGVLTLNRPAQRNPLDRETVQQLNEHLDALLADPTVRAVVVTGSPPAFSAGGDMEKYIDLYQDFAGFESFLAAIRHAFDRLESSRLVSIAAVNGVCVAGGFELALACDLIVMDTDARIGDAHLRFWQLPGGGGTQRLPRAIGSMAAKRLLYTAELLDAEQARGMGLVAEVAPPGGVLDAALELAERVTRAPEATIVTAKQLLAAAANQPLAAGLSTEQAVVASYTHGADSAASRGLHLFLGRSPGPAPAGSSSPRSASGDPS